LLNFTIDDGTETIKAVAFQDALISLGFTDLNNLEELFTKKEDLLGKEMFFHGTVRSNKMFNTPELIIEKAEEVNPDLLIAELSN